MKEDSEPFLLKEELRLEVPTFGSSSDGGAGEEPSTTYKSHQSVKIPESQGNVCTFMVLYLRVYHIYII